MNRLLRIVGLTVVYLAAIGSLTWWDAGVGAAVGSAVAMVARDRRTARRWTPSRLAALPGLLVGALTEIVRGSAAMTRLLLRRQPPRHGGMVDMEAPARTAGGRVLTAVVTTASPGSIVVGVDRRRRHLRLHAIDAREPARTRGDVERFYRRHQRHAVP